MTDRITADDFFTSLFVDLARRGETVFSWRDERFDHAVAKAFETLVAEASANDVKVAFRIRLHRFHGDSETIRRGVTRAAQRDLVTLDNPEFQDIRLKLRTSDAAAFLDEPPIEGEFFETVVDTFLSEYGSSA